MRWSRAPARCWSSEFLFTFALAWVVLQVATAPGTEGNSFYGLAIGFIVPRGRARGRGISGGAFNTAIGIGAMVTALFEWSNIWIYLIADCLEAAAAAVCVPVRAIPAEKETGSTSRPGEYRVSTEPV